MRSDLMKSTITFILLISFAGLQSIKATSNTDGKLKFSDVFIQFGTSITNQREFNLLDYRKLAPGSLMLNNDFSNYSQSNNQYGSDAGLFLAGISLFNSNKK